MKTPLNLLILLAACTCALAVSGCGDGKEKKSNGKPDGERGEVKVTPPESPAEAMQKLTAAVASVKAATSIEEKDEAAYKAEAEIKAVADYLTDTEAPKVEDVVSKTKLRGSAQQLRVMATKLHELAHENAPEALAKLLPLIDAEIAKIQNLLGDPG